MRHTPARWWLRLQLALLAILLAAAAGVVVVSTGGVRALLRPDPPKADYTWLREGLDHAGEAADRAARSTGRGGTIAAARTLEDAIRYSRASARRTGTRPIPIEIREEFADYFPEHLLDKLTWAFSNEHLDLATMVAFWYGSEGGAVTLQDTIVYSNENAVRNRLLWAHELTHALQYDELGIERFSRIYVTNPQLLEQQARKNALEIMSDISRAKQRGGDERG